MTQMTMQNARTPATAALAMAGIERGTEVMTLTGIRPVESLHEGDRIITRMGACPLRGVQRTPTQAFRLLFDTPQIVFLGEGQIDSETCMAVAA